MAKTWKHTKLGVLTFDSNLDGWVGKCELPGFKIFTLKPRTKKVATSVQLFIESPDGKAPAAKLVTLAEKVIVNQALIAPQIAPTFFEDFQGRGPSSGMWWHGDKEQIQYAFQEAGKPVPKAAKDFYPLMRLSRLLIHRGVYKYNKPIAEFTFATVFEEEHGIGFLTDGEKILGTGYADDASPFDA